MEYWIWLTLIKGIGPLISKRLLEKFNTPEDIFNAEHSDLIKISGIGDATAKGILNSKSLEESKRILDNCDKNNIKIITCNDKKYIDISVKYPEMPIVLYYKGEIINKTGIAIVGSRRCSSYGKRVVVEAAEYLARNNLCVISGMAKGIDGYAHTTCLDAGGYTIAFLGNGLDTCYPKEHAALMESIIENGAVISEYPPGVKAKAEHFPRRNFLISSWCEKILVVEASKNSGALITAKIAKAQGKKVPAVPCDVYSITGEGTNRLIFDGAEIYLNPKQLLFGCDENSVETSPNEQQFSDVQEIHSDNTINKNRSFNELELKILSYIKDESKTIDEIAKLINKKPSEFIQYITMLEIEGTIKSQPGGRYAKTLVTTKDSRNN